jgi:hypothetical protein
LLAGSFEVALERLVGHTTRAMKRLAFATIAARA